MSVVGIFIYIPSTLPDKRKANPGFTNCPMESPDKHRYEIPTWKWFQSIGLLSDFGDKGTGRIVDLFLKLELWSLDVLPREEPVTA